LALNPACRLVASAYPVDRVWALNQPDAQWEQPLDSESGGVELPVLRSGYEVAMEGLGRGEFALLAALADGCRLGEAFDQAVAVEGGLDLCGFLQRHILRASLGDFRR